MENGAARAFRARRFVTLINASTRQAIYADRAIRYAVYSAGNRREREREREKCLVGARARALESSLAE